MENKDRIFKLIDEVFEEMKNGYKKDITQEDSTDAQVNNVDSSNIPNNTSNNVAPTNVESKPKTTIVNFDKNTDNPYQVTFTERGFLIDDTRMSFEEIEKALSKEYNIVLKNGKGFVLDQVKMQKILKYKDI